MIKENILTVSLLVLSIAINAQISTHPSDIVWKRIVTEQARIVYPEGQKQRADRVANLISAMQKPEYSIFNTGKRRIDIVLQTNQVISNGYVGIAPFRSEFYLTPPQDQNFIGSMDWLDVLSIHEYRHVQQALAADVGLTRFLHVLFGQGGWGLGKGYAIPNWFDEGDAVMTETKLSKSGRGRTPEFFARQRAVLNTRSPFQFMKAVGGSFKHLVPDEYTLGYLMCNYIESKNDHEIWSKIIPDAARMKYPFYPFSGALKRNIGENIIGVYQSSMEFFKETAMQAADTSFFSKPREVSKEFKYPTFYYFPQESGQDTILAYKTSYYETPAVVAITSGKEFELTRLGIGYDAYVSVRDEHFVWTEFSQSPRWTNRNYSDVFLFNIHTREKRQITNRGRFFSPHLNMEKTKVVAAYTDSDLISGLSVIDVENGKAEYIALGYGEQAIYPKWHDSGKIIYIRKRKGQLAFFEFEPQDSVHSQITDWTYDVINHPTVTGNTVVFTSSISDKDEIYSFDLDNPGVWYQHTQALNGAYMPSVTQNGNLVYSDIIFNGNRIGELPFSQDRRAQPSDSGDLYVSSRNVSSQMVENLDSTSYEEGGYKRTLRTQWHTRLPWFDPAVPGYEVLFENLLSNVSGSVGAGYNLNEKNLEVFSSLYLSSKFPVFSLTGARTSRVFSFRTDDTTIVRLPYAENRASAGVDIPLTYVNGNYVTSLNVGAFYNFRYFTSEPNHPFYQRNHQDGEIFFSIAHRRRRALQNVGTKWGQDLFVSWRGDVVYSQNTIWRAGTNLYFPGFSQNHRTKISAEYQTIDRRGVYGLADRFRYVRGSDYVPNREVLRTSIDYAFPLWYSDFAIWRFVYFKRFWANAYVDYTTSDAFFSDGKVFGAGLEMYFDVAGSSGYPFTFGFRLGYVGQEGQHNFRPGLIFDLPF